MDQIKKLSKLIVVLIWVLSLLTTHNFYLYRLTIQLVTHAIDKNYMFLLCNGLLVFVAKCSSFIAWSKPVEEGCRKTGKTFDYGDFESYNAILELDGSGTESFLAEEVTESVEDCKTVSLHVDSSLESDTKDEESGEQEEEEEVVEEDELDGGFEEEEKNVVVVTEEDQDMNKKFDEFIRKMKEELRIEAKQHLILV